MSLTLRGTLQRSPRVISNQNLSIRFQSWYWNTIQIWIQKIKAFWRNFMQKNQTIWLVLKILELQGFSLQPVWGDTPTSMKNDQNSTHQSHPTTNFYIHPKKTLLPPIITWGLKTKNGNKNSQKKKKKSVFLRNLYKTFGLWCKFLLEFKVHDHEKLLQTEKEKLLLYWSRCIHS